MGQYVRFLLGACSNDEPTWNDAFGSVCSVVPQSRGRFGAGCPKRRGLLNRRLQRRDFIFETSSCWVCTYFSDSAATAQVWRCPRPRKTCSSTQWPCASRGRQTALYHSNNLSSCLPSSRHAQPCRAGLPGSASPSAALPSRPPARAHAEAGLRCWPFLMGDSLATATSCSFDAVASFARGPFVQLYD